MKNVILFGTGSGGVMALEMLRMQGAHIKAVFSRESCDEWHGFQVKTETELGEYLAQEKEDCCLVIASQYCGAILDRLTARGFGLPDCYGINLYKQGTPYHNDQVIPFTDRSYQQLESYLADEHSKQILHKIMENRCCIDAPSFILGAAMKEYSGDEDYWHTIKAHRRFEKAVIIDGGAYIGDSIEPLCRAIGPQISYYAFEPEADTCEELIRNAAAHQDLYAQFTAIPKGLWSSNTDLYFDTDNEFRSAFHFSDQSNVCVKKVAVQQLDSMDFAADTDFFIKMDIEGSEMEALRGAEKLIRSRKPSLAVCVYHKENDIVDIPLYLKSLVPEYKLYLCGGSHTICIAQKEE